MAMKFTVKVTQDWKRSMRERNRGVTEAAVAALKETAANAVDEGRRDIATAGAFGSRWQSGLKYRLQDEPDGVGPTLQAKAIIFHRIGLAGVFESGATIKGKPLLWIPTQPGAPPPRKAGKKLVSVNIAGKPPMLFEKFKRGSDDRKPLYIGVPQVRIPKKWHITEIVMRHAKRIAVLFIKHFKS